jgi:hypothetical protein
MSVKYMDIGQNIRIYIGQTQVIGQISAKISVSVSVADMLVHIYRYWQRYRLGEYIGIGWTHISPTGLQLLSSLVNMSQFVLSSCFNFCQF